MDALRRRYRVVQFGVRGKRNSQIEDIVLVQVRSDSCRTRKEKASAIRLATGHIIQTASLESRFFNTEKRDSTDAWLRPSAAAMSLNDAPFAFICKSCSSSSADQIVEVLEAPVRTIPPTTSLDCPSARCEANYGSHSSSYNRL